MAPDAFFQRLDTYVEYKVREMAVRLHLVEVNELRARTLGEEAEKAKRALREALGERETA